MTAKIKKNQVKLVKSVLLPQKTKC